MHKLYAVSERVTDPQVGTRALSALGKLLFLGAGGG